MHKQETAYAQYGRIIRANFFRTVKKQPGRDLETVIDLDYSHGQMQFCNQGVFYGPVDIPTIFQEEIDRTLGHQTPVWLDDISVVARATKEQHTQKLESLLTNLENEGYRARKTKSKFYQKRQ